MGEADAEADEEAERTACDIEPATKGANLTRAPYIKPELIARAVLNRRKPTAN